MRRFATSLIVALSASAALAQEPTFRASTHLVSVDTTVFDAQRRLVPCLERDDFTLLDDGRPQEITFFQNEVQPLTVVVMLDHSASMLVHRR